MQSIKPVTEHPIEALFVKSLAEQLGSLGHTVKITVAYSGGPDSTVLLHLLKKYQKQFGYQLDAAHVNHGLRSAEEMLAEEKCVRQNADDSGIPLHTKKLAPGFLDYYAGRHHCGLEAAARIYRYHFFDKIQKLSHRPSLLALGHNSNDQVETVMMRLFAGGGIEGLKGIPLQTATLIRPLMHIERDLIMTYLNERGFSYVHDSSNFEEIYLRNRIRLKLLSQVEEIFPHARSSLIRLGTEVSSVLEHYNHLLESACPWERQGDKLSCLASDFMKLPFVSRRGMVLKMMNTLQRNNHEESRIPRNFFLPLDSPDYAEGIILKGHSILFVRKKNHLILSDIQKPGFRENLYFHLNSVHPFMTDQFILKILPVTGKRPPDSSVLLFLPMDSAVIRSPYSQSEKQHYTRAADESIYVVQGGREEFCVLDSSGNGLTGSVSGQKRSEFASDSLFQCVIIKGRGDYAPG